MGELGRRHVCDDEESRALEWSLSRRRKRRLHCEGKIEAEVGENARRLGRIIEARPSVWICEGADRSSDPGCDLVAALDDLVALTIGTSPHQDRMARGVRPDLDSRLRRELRSEEHTSELQSHSDLVCRLLLEKKNK